MLLSAVSVLVVAQSSSEIPEGLMNNPVYLLSPINLHDVCTENFTMYRWGYSKDSATGECHCSLHYRQSRKQNIDLTYVRALQYLFKVLHQKTKATEGIQRTNTVEKYTHPSLFAVSQIRGVAPRIKVYHSTLHYIGASELFDNSKRSSSHTAWRTRSWMGNKGNSHHHVLQGIKNRINFISLTKLKPTHSLGWVKVS